MSEFSTHARALVVEDDLWMKPVITSALKKALPGIVIDWVESAEDALDKTRASNYSLIMADINLQPNRQTGIDFWKDCNEHCPEVPILLTSSIPVDAFAEKMGVYGPYYLLKPFSVAQCQEVIENMVSFFGPCS